MRERGEAPFILLKSGVRFATFWAIPQIRPDMSFSPPSPVPLTRPSLQDSIATFINGSLPIPRGKCGGREGREGRACTAASARCPTGENSRRTNPQLGAKWTTPTALAHSPLALMAIQFCPRAAKLCLCVRVRSTARYRSNDVQAPTDATMMPPRQSQRIVLFSTLTAVSRHEQKQRNSIRNWTWTQTWVAPRTIFLHQILGKNHGPTNHLTLL